MSTPKTLTKLPAPRQLQQELCAGSTNEQHTTMTPISTWNGNLESIDEVEAREGIIARTLPLGYVGPSELDYLRMTKPDEREEVKEWARRKAKQRE